MAEQPKGDEEVKVVTPTAEEAEAAKAAADEQDPLKKELEKVQNKGTGRTKREKLLFSKNKIEEQLRGLDEEEGAEDLDEDDEDDKPITRGELKQIQQRQVVKTALSLADDIQNETERELVKYHIANTIRTTGNATEDLSIARAIVNSKKNAQIAEEATRRTTAATHSGASSAPANRTTAQSDDLTAEEQSFMRPPFNLSKEQVLKARQGK